MTMHEVKVFLIEDALVQLEDEYLDKESDLRHLIYSPLKELAKQASMVFKNNQFMANTVDENNRQKQDMIKLNEFDLDKFEVESDPDWLPENIPKEKSTSYSIKVGDRTWKLLETYFKLYQARIDLYNKSLKKDRKDYDDVKAIPATCQEEILHGSLIKVVMDKISSSIDKELDEEFEEIYKPKDKKQKPDRTGKKKQ